jgi:hypothetical protein
VVVGHGANGLIVKAMPLLYDPWRISFEGPRMQDSAMESLADNPNARNAQTRIVNFFTDDSLLVQDDGAALTNHRIPKYGLLPGIPPNPFETFCFFAVACGSDDRFDNLCIDVLGNETYLDLWDELGRRRIQEGENNDPMAKGRENPFTDGEASYWSFIVNTLWENPQFLNRIQ